MFRNGFSKVLKVHAAVALAGRLNVALQRRVERSRALAMTQKMQVGDEIFGKGHQEVNRFEKGRSSPWDEVPRGARFHLQLRRYRRKSPPRHEANRSNFAGEVAGRVQQKYSDARKLPCRPIYVFLSEAGLKSTTEPRSLLSNQTPPP